MIWVSETTEKLVASTVPNATPVAPVNPVPVMVTFVPPVFTPVDGSTFDTWGVAPAVVPVVVVVVVVVEVEVEVAAVVVLVAAVVLVLVANGPHETAL